ncbi:MAG: NAD(P)H-dependent glycerol-3-phosphate dehydrogenase [Pseudomonadota bacterium]
MPDNTRIGVLGAGSWGTALACHLTGNGHDVKLWGRDATQIATLQRERVNARYLPDTRIPDSLQCESDFSACVANTDALLVATPSGAFAQTLNNIVDSGADQTPVIWACKGLEKGSGRQLEPVAREILGDDLPLAVISGPTFAKELMQGLPTAITVASRDTVFAERVARWLHSETFRAYSSDDVVGVETGGALKNVLAIAAGISDGLGFGANARAALITRGLAELMRLGVAMGGRAETFMGLAGMGDLVLTCTDNLSRNRRMGLALARGLSVSDAQEEIGQAVEGVGTAREAVRLAEQFNVEMPIAEQVFAVLYEGKLPRNAVRDLLGRGQRAESR